MNDNFKIKKIKNWIVPFIGVVLYFVLLLYFRLLITAQKSDLLPTLVEDFFVNLPVLIANIVLTYWGVQLFNKHFFERTLIKILLELIYAFLMTALLVFAMGGIMATIHGEGQFDLKAHINIFGDIFIMGLLIAVFTLTVLETHYQREISKQKELDFEQMQQENLKLKYIQLKNQINPHFLFNSLNILTALTRSNQDKAVEFIQKLSETYRYVLFQDQKDLVTLEEELHFIRSFTDILKSRFDKGLQINISINQEDLRKKIVPMTLQLLIENAVKHNVVDESTPLIVKIESDGLQIIVHNNLNPRIMVQKGHKIGLDSIKKRYQVMNDSEVKIIQADQMFTVKIPLL